MKKKYLLLSLVSLVSLGLAGCKKEKTINPEEDWAIYHEDFVYDTPRYEPIDVARDGGYPYAISVIDIPEKGIPQTLWDEYNIKLRCFYTDGIRVDYNLQEKNIPVEYRHYLGEVGKHTININYGLMPLSFEFNITANPSWTGFTCYFFDMDNKLIHTQIVGYYADLTYTGPDIPTIEEDEDYQYRFTGWNQPTKNISQDMQFKTVYEKIEKRNYSVKPHDGDYVGITGIVDQDKQKGSALFYLGRVRRVAAIYGEAKEFAGDEISISFNYRDFGPYWREMNETIIGSIQYKHDPNYDSYIHGSVANILATPDFGTVMDPKYAYEGGTKVNLEDGKEITTSAQDPYVFLANRVLSYTDNTETIKGSEINYGFYRLAVVFDFDVYLSMSYTKLSKEAYEIGAFNQFVCCPVLETATYTVQYSENGEFEDNFNTHLTLSNRAVYSNAASLDWEAK